MVHGHRRATVWPPVRRNRMFKNVIVGVDGGEGGRDAIALAKVLVVTGAA